MTMLISKNIVQLQFYIKHPWTLSIWVWKQIWALICTDQYSWILIFYSQRSVFSTWDCRCDKDEFFPARPKTHYGHNLWLCAVGIIIYNPLTLIFFSLSGLSLQAMRLHHHGSKWEESLYALDHILLGRGPLRKE